MIFLTLAIGATTGVLGARPAMAASGWYQIYNPYSNKCLDNWGSHTSLTQIRQYNCWNGNQQLWRTVYQCCGDPVAHWDVIQNAFSGYCVDVKNGWTQTQNEPIVQYSCNNNDMAQNFYAKWNPDGYRTLSATCTNRACGGLGQPTSYMITEGSTANGNGATITYYNGGSSQLWLGGGL